MHLDFRQGLVSFQADSYGNPQFLQAASAGGNFVSLMVMPTPTTVTFAQGKADYLATFDMEKDAAWGPLTAGRDNYLYWEMDLLSSTIKYGITTLEPVVAAIAPTVAEVDGQLWFDTTATTMKRWQQVSRKWISVIVVFAGKVINGSVAHIVPYGKGTQVGLNVAGNPGYVMLDSQLQPLRTSTGEFLTTDTPVRIKNTVGTSGVLATAPNMFIPVRAGENLPAMSLVYFSADDTVSLASGHPTHIGRKTPVGIVQTALAVNEVGNLTQYGDVTYDQWDWSGFIGRAVYSDDVGRLTTSRPAGLMAYRVGFIKNANTIIFGVDAETEPQVYQASSAQIVFTAQAPINLSDTINNLGERVVSVSASKVVAGVSDGIMTKEQATDLARASADANTALGQINAVSTRVGVVEADVANLKTTAADQTTAIAANTSGVATLTQQVNLLTGQSVSLTTRVTALETSQANQDTLIANLASRTGALETGKLDKNAQIPISQVTNLQTELNDIRQNAGVKNLNQLQDVDVVGLVNDSTLVWDSTFSKWLPRDRSYFKGDTGATGPAGPTGAAGPEGPTQYQYDVDNGIWTGTQEEWWDNKINEWTEGSNSRIDGGSF